MQDGAGLVRTVQADETGGLYGLADEAAVRQMVDRIARENLAAHGYDPALLDGALAPGCEAGSGSCIYVEAGAGCGHTDPLVQAVRRAAARSCPCG